MSSLQDLLNPISSGPSSPAATRLPSPPPIQKYGLPSNTQEAASTLAFFANHHRNSFGLPSNELDDDRSPVTPIGPHHDSSSSDTVSSSPVPPVSPRRIGPMRDPTVIKSPNGFTQFLRASSSERDADGDEEDEEMGEDSVKPQGLTGYHLSPTLIVQETLRSSPPAASASPPSTTAPTPKDTTATASSTTTKSKKRLATKTIPTKKKGIAKPQKKKRKIVVEEDDLETETPASAQRPISVPPTKQLTESPPPVRSLPPLPLSPLLKYNAEGMELYCVCRKPDSGKWMIGCDGCEDWFHGECINVAEQDGDLIDKYFCPRCEVSGHGTTTWKRKCRLPTCRRPAQVDKRPKPSKYCCDDHGVQFFKLKTTPGSTSTVSQSSLAVVANTVSSATEFRRIGYRMPTPPLSDENFRDYPEEIERLVIISKERESLKNQRLLTEDRGHYVEWAQERAKHIHEELKADPEARNVGKEICGYDERLGLGDSEWATWRNSSDGNDIFKERRITGREGVCLKKKCEKHGQWKPLFMEEAQLHERLHQERLVQLRQEEKKIKERQKRRSVRDNREGTVEMEK